MHHPVYGSNWRRAKFSSSSTPSKNCPSKKSSPETQSRKEVKQHSRTKKNKRKSTERTVTLPSNQNGQPHQSSQRKSRINESHQISNRFLPQLRIVSRFDSSSRLLFRGDGASPSAAKVVGEQVVVNRRKCFAAWNWSRDDYLVQQPTR